MRLGPGRIDRQDGEVFGRGRGVCEPLDERSQAVVLVSIQRDHAQRVPSRLASVRVEPAHVDRRCRGHGPPDRQTARTPSDGASRRPPAEPAHRSLHDGSQVAGETGAPRRVEPLDGHHEGEGAGLHSILERHVPRRDPASERHDEPPQGLDQRVPDAEPAFARRAGRCETGLVDHPIELPDEPRRAERQRGEIGGERRRRLTRRRARLPRASHPIVPGTEAPAESSGSRRSDQEAPADGRRIGPPWIHGSQCWRPASWMPRTRAAVSTSATRASASSAISAASVTASSRRRRRGTVWPSRHSPPAREDSGGSRVRLSIGRRGGVSHAVGGARRPRRPARPGCRSRAGLACAPRCAALRAPPRGSRRAE